MWSQKYGKVLVPRTRKEINRSSGRCSCLNGKGKGDKEAE